MSHNNQFNVLSKINFGSEIDTLPSAATVHFLSKQTAQGSRHGVRQSFTRQPHSLKSTNRKYQSTSEISCWVFDLGIRYFILSNLDNAHQRKAEERRGNV